MRPSLGLPFNLIRVATTNAIAAAREAHVNNKLEDAVNWADLRVVSVEFYETDSGYVGWRVLIAEVSPTASNFQRFIHEYLTTQGLRDVEVITDW